MANANACNTPKGSFYGSTRSFSINANDQLTDPKKYNDIILAYKNGALVFLRDVATVEQGAENEKLGALMGERVGSASGAPATPRTAPALIVNIQRQPGANVIAVADAIKALLPIGKPRRRPLST